MSSDLTLWGANEFSRILFGNRSELPHAYYLALAVSGLPNPYMSGNEIIEPTPGSGYGRLMLLNDPSLWDTDGYQIAYNINQLTWTEAVEDWGEVKYWALCNADTEGEVYFYGAFETPMRVYAGNIPTINPAALKVEMSAGILIQGSLWQR